MANQEQDAFNVINQVCGAYVGNLEDHQKIQSALQVIDKFINPAPLDKPEKKDAKN